MLRRIYFVGIVPLISIDASRRAAFGLFSALLSVACFREIEPFINPATNVLNQVAQYLVLGNYAVALSVETGLSKNLDPVKFGIIIITANLVLIMCVLALSIARHRQDRLRMLWRRPPTPSEMVILNEILMMKVKNKVHSNDSIEEFEMDNLEGPSASEAHSDSSAILRQHLLRSQDVSLIKYVGAGAFGEVFKGTCMGQPVAVKTLKDVTYSNVLAFRDEILLTGVLRHPNIVCQSAFILVFKV